MLYIRELMHDFCCWDADDMNYDLMQQATRYYKETQEGVEYMCKAFEEKMKQGYDRGLEVGLQQGMEQGMLKGADSERIRIIRLLMNNPTMGQKLSAQQAMKMLNIPAEEQARYLQML